MNSGSQTAVFFVPNAVFHKYHDSDQNDCGSVCRTKGRVAAAAIKIWWGGGFVPSDYYLRR